MDPQNFMVPLDKDIEILSNPESENIVWFNNVKVAYQLLRFYKKDKDSESVAQGATRSFFIDIEELKELRNICTHIPAYKFKAYVHPRVRDKVLSYFAKALHYASTDQLADYIRMYDNDLTVYVPPIDKLDVMARNWHEYGRRQIALMIVECLKLHEFACTSTKEHTCSMMAARKEHTLGITNQCLGHENKDIFRQAVDELSMTETDIAHQIISKYPRSQCLFI